MKTRSKATQILRAMLARRYGFGASPNKQRPGLCGHGGIACELCPEFGVRTVIPKVRLSRILQGKPATVAFLSEIFGITFCLFLLLVFSNSRLNQNNSG